MSKYQEFLAECKKTSKGNNYSKNELVGLATAMFNDTDCTIPVYVKKGETFEERAMHPSRALRDNLIAPIVKSFGVDRAEMARLSEVQTSRAGGESLADFSLLLLKQYVSKNGLGRKLTLPMTSPKEAVQTISTVMVDKEERATTRINRNDDGTYSISPTGKVVTTEAHEKIKIGNRVPVWMKKTTDKK